MENHPPNLAEILRQLNRMKPWKFISLLICVPSALIIWNTPELFTDFVTFITKL